jgi:hypothetical protein
MEPTRKRIRNKNVLKKGNVFNMDGLELTF